MEKMIFHLFMLFITSGLWLVALAVVHFVAKNKYVKKLLSIHKNNISLYEKEMILCAN